MIIEKKGFVFDYQTVSDCIDDLKKITYHPVFVSDEVKEKVSKLLKLEDKKTERELRAVRNAVVDICSTYQNRALGIDEEGNRLEEVEINYPEYEMWRILISSVVAVVDDCLWKRGFEV